MDIGSSALCLPIVHMEEPLYSLEIELRLFPFLADVANIYIYEEVSTTLNVN